MAKIKTLESEEIIVKGLKAQEKGELFNQKRLLPTVKHGSGAVMMWASVFRLQDLESLWTPERPGTYLKSRKM